MPGGIPVATVALNGAKNAGLLAASIIGASNQAIFDKLTTYKEALKEKVLKSAQDLENGNY